jgi:hypothetical protein
LYSRIGDIPKPVKAIKTSSRILGFKEVIIAVVILLAGQNSFASSMDKRLEISAVFLEGEVRIVNFKNEWTRFHLVGSDAVVDVRNDIHIRLVKNPYHFPKTFPILAPMTAVNVLAGEVPSSFLHEYTLKYYLQLRDEYDNLKKKYERGFIGTETNSANEKIVNKLDTEHIFGLKRNEWDVHTQTTVHSDEWEVQLAPKETGTVVRFIDRKMQMGLTIQPHYPNDNSPPEKLVVGSYFRKGTLPEFTERFKKNLESQAAAELGPDYSVTATYNTVQSLEVIQLIVTKNAHKEYISSENDS